MRTPILRIKAQALLLRASLFVLEKLALLGVDCLVWGCMANLGAKLGREDLADRCYFVMQARWIHRNNWYRSMKFFPASLDEADGRRGITEHGPKRVNVDLRMDEEGINSIVGRMDGWLDSMRHPDGYGGPVVHWWRDCLDFAGVGLDWRYEGIILGYLNLFQATGRQVWLDKAIRAGNDLIAGQLASGKYRNSNFEMNPQSGGNPHEAACDLGLLHLARELRRLGRSAWEEYYLAADRNLRAYILGALWDPESCFFRNRPDEATFVPNKAATIAEALMVWEGFNAESDFLERFVIPTLDKILVCQVRNQDHRFEGAIDQGWLGRKSLGRYFPFYIARCIPALIDGFRSTGYERYHQAAWLAMSFVLRQQLEDGSFPQVIYRSGRINRYPQWIAGAGDVLRAMDLMEVEGMDISANITQGWLLNGLLPNGGIRTAIGFGSYLSQRPPRKPDVRDVIPVCGWVDKAFRYLTSKVGEDPEGEVREISAVEMECVFRGQQVRYRENSKRIECWGKDQLIYRWEKGETWAHMDLPQMDYHPL